MNILFLRKTESIVVMETQRDVERKLSINILQKRPPVIIDNVLVGFITSDLFEVAIASRNRNGWRPIAFGRLMPSEESVTVKLVFRPSLLSLAMTYLLIGVLVLLVLRGFILNLSVMDILKPFSGLALILGVAAVGFYPESSLLSTRIHSLLEADKKATGLDS